VSDAVGARDFFAQRGCGPTAIAPYGAGFLVLCHLGARIVAVDSGGRELRRWDRADAGTPLTNPNDASADGRGGVYFSDPGRFAREARAQGWILHLAADGALRRVAGPLRYPNGVHVAGGMLYVSEHLQHRILRYEMLPTGALGEARTFADLTRVPRAARYRVAYALTGPDGLEFGPDGDLYVAIYGEGRLLRFSPGGALLGTTEFPVRYLTNVAFGARGVALTGAFDNRAPPFPGEVTIMPVLPAMHAPMGDPPGH
jgi:gluconolactonase